MLVLKSKRPGTVYVMTSGRKVRVGHHSTSKIARERQVSGGTGETWKIIFEQVVGSKLEACAVEAVAQAILGKHEAWQQAKQSRMQFFKCSHKEAKEAVQRALVILKKEGCVTPITITKS